MTTLRRERKQKFIEILSKYYMGINDDVLNELLDAAESRSERKTDEEGIFRTGVYLFNDKVKGIEASILQGRPTTEEDVNPAKFEHDALVAFEEAFKVTNGNIPWFKTQYKALREFLVKRYAEDKDAFKKYRVWYNENGQYRGGMNAVQIKRKPDDFLLSWDAFMADTVKVETTQREEGQSGGYYA